MLALFQETINNRSCAYTASSDGHKITVQNTLHYLRRVCVCYVVTFRELRSSVGHGEKKKGGGKRVSVYCPTTSEVENATIVEREKISRTIT